MNIAPTSAAKNLSGGNTWPKPASAVPTSTGATDAGSVLTLAAISQMRTPLGARAGAAVVIVCSPARSRPARELGEVRPALLEVGVAALLGLLRHVEEEVRVMGQLLEAGEPVLVGVEAGLQQPEREGGHAEHLPAPPDGFGLELGQRHDRVDEPHPQRLPRIVL